MKQYNILDYGAIADGVTNNAAAIQQAIDEASAEGGRVVIPQGKYLSGTLVLKSNIDFHLEKGAVLISSLNQEDIMDFAKLFEDRLERGLEAQAFSGREIGGDDDVLDFFVGHLVDLDLARQPAA